MLLPAAALGLQTRLPLQEGLRDISSPVAVTSAALGHTCADFPFFGLHPEQKSFPRTWERMV